ncbi:MAG TPA: hypothetical protein VNU84_08175 [Candidatus Acidoferrum sp.]|nr:hypothetical protein [Candidatus Acidoferrum sp.]
MQIERRSGHAGLAQHNVDLSAMVRLMIKEVTSRDRCLFNIFLALVVDVPKRPLKEIDRQVLKELLNTRIFVGARRAKRRKVVEQNRIQRRRSLAAPFEAGHPDAIAKQQMIEQSMNAPERTRPLPPIFAITQLGAAFKKSLIGDVVVARKNPKMCPQFHLPRLPSACPSVQ